jgi:hypothetical protein
VAGLALLPCNAIPISEDLASSVILMRTGEHNEGVVGLRQTGIALGVLEDCQITA